MLEKCSEYKEVNPNRNKIFALFAWILFLGVMPFDKGALTLYYNDSIGKYIGLALNAITVLLALVGFANRMLLTKSQIRISRKYIYFFAVLLVAYLFSGFVTPLSITRIFSMICLLGYYLHVICNYDDVIQLLKDVNRALFVIIALSVILYIAGSEHVMYTENATTEVFKGIADNRNSYAEFTLFFVVSNFCLWRHNKSSWLWRLLTSAVAVYTTIMTNGATSIICMYLLVFLLIAIAIWKSIGHLVSFNVFSVVYVVVFAVMVMSQYTEWGALQFIIDTFEKSSSLTGRTDIWRVTIEQISANPIFGFGYESNALLEVGIVENDPHNSVLYTMFTQGIVGILAFVVMTSFLWRKDVDTKIKGNILYNAMAIFVMVWFVRGLTESVFSYSHFVFWCALIIMEKISHDTLAEAEDA